MISGQTLILLELVLVFGAIVAFGVWQLRSVRREMRRDEARRAADAAASSSGGGSAEAGRDG